jgi:hypothetical protein
VDNEIVERLGRLMVACSSETREAPMRTISLLMLLMLLWALCGCAYAPVSSPQLDARALCQQQAQASASAPEASDTQKYFDQCMIAKSKEKPKAGHE